MAGDWIKMRSDLFTHPKVVRISSALKADTLRTVGGLMSAWCLFDAHSVDGTLEGYTPETLDSHLRWEGFSAAMIAVQWLTFDGESLALPEFDTHNGASAKRRAQDANRKRDVRNMSASDADKKRTREEKRREEKKEDQETGAEAPVDSKKKFWDYVTAIAGGDQQARKRIGKLSKEYGEEPVMKALAEAALRSPADPVGYAARIVQKAESQPWDGAL